LNSHHGEKRRGGSTGDIKLRGGGRDNFSNGKKERAWTFQTARELKKKER